MTSDSDPVETSEWRESFDSVLEFDGVDRASFLLEELINEAPRNEIRLLIRWNAVAFVLRANKEFSELGGHIASFQSAAGRGRPPASAPPLPQCQLA